MRQAVGIAIVTLVSAALLAQPAWGEQPSLATATFAGGCFWCMEQPFDAQPGVISSTAGYTGGHKIDPTYAEVSSGSTGHTEAVKIVYDPKQLSYQDLLEIFWRNIDPTTPDRQFCDRGSQYRAGIFYHNAEQQRAAELSKKRIEDSGKIGQPIVTEIVTASVFYPAEDHHQDYYLKNPLRYKYYRHRCGRDQRLAEIW